MPIRDVYLISVPYSTALPHWTIWIPVDSDEPMGFGKKIHAVGSPQFGFKVEVSHRFDWHETRTGERIKLFHLGSIDSSNIVDIDERIVTNEVNNKDEFEKVAGRIQAPGVASSDVMPKGTVSQVTEALRHDIPNMRRCQEWAMEYIEALVKAGLLEADKANNAIVNAKNMNPFPPTWN
ncbi:hypothetical protein H0H87_001640 [Tephrocybe sp. NHM501043]|nr:hypothetical protein H0H87_001640 [Tephrocybe sp. NHM501043]